MKSLSTWYTNSRPFFSSGEQQMQRVSNCELWVQPFVSSSHASTKTSRTWKFGALQLTISNQAIYCPTLKDPLDLPSSSSWTTSYSHLFASRHPPSLVGSNLRHRRSVSHCGIWIECWSENCASHELRTRLVGMPCFIFFMSFSKRFFSDRSTLNFAHPGVPLLLFFFLGWISTSASSSPSPCPNSMSTGLVGVLLEKVVVA